MRGAGEGGGAQVRRCAWTRTLAHDAAIGGNLRRWITGEGSLTARLIAASARFRVTRLAQGMEAPLLDEWRTIGLAIPRPVIARDVLLICDDTPAIYAHSIVHPLRARRDWPFLGGLGERPLGGALFVDPRVRREPFEFARLLPHHPLMRRLQGVLPELAQSAMLPARRSVFRRGQGAMLVTEVFLPDLVRRKAPPAEAGSAAGLPMPERPARPGR